MSKVQTRINALEKSVNYWTNIALGKEPCQGRKGCACCDEFFGYSCQGCPIYIHTNEMSCHGTPYENWTNHRIDKHRDKHSETGTILCKECSAIAWEEVEFLEMLLEKERVDENSLYYKIGMEVVATKENKEIAAGTKGVISELDKRPCRIQWENGQELWTRLGDAEVVDS